MNPDKSQVVSTMPLLVDVLEAGRLLSVSRSCIFQLIADNKIASVKVDRRRRVIVASLHAYIASLTPNHWIIPT